MRKLQAPRYMLYGGESALNLIVAGPRRVRYSRNYYRESTISSAARSEKLAFTHLKFSFLHYTTTIKSNLKYD